MNFVQPIRDVAKIENMKDYLKSSKERDYILFLMGISIGLRISDLLQIKKEDVFHSHLDIKEVKTKKRKRVKIPGYIKKEIQAYANKLEDGTYLFISRQGDNKPIDRSTAYRILRGAAHACNVKEVGTHTIEEDVWVSLLSADERCGDVARTVQP